MAIVARQPCWSPHDLLEELPPVRRKRAADHQTGRSGRAIDCEQVGQSARLRPHRLLTDNGSVLPTEPAIRRLAPSEALGNAHRCVPTRAKADMRRSPESCVAGVWDAWFCTDASAVGGAIVRFVLAAASCSHPSRETGQIRP
jgi:hypothetical protein